MPSETPQVRFAPGSSFDLDFLADLYTQTFADYFYPCVVTTEDLAEWIRTEHLDLDRCPVMLLEDQPIGFATVGIRGKESYCRGFGVVVPQRGKGLSHALCDEMVRQARDTGAKRMTLGVIKENTRAVRAYREAGFQVRRELVSVEWRADANSSGESRGEEVVEASAEDLLSHFDSLHAVQPIWNRDLPSLKELKGLQGLGVMTDGVPIAYVLLQAARGVAQTIDFGARSDSEGEQGLGAILAYLQTSHPQLACPNEPLDNPALATLLANGFSETVRRLELELSL